MTGYKRHREMEVYLTTFDGAQHLRLHGWLKRNDTLIKSENIVDQDDYFGVFMVYITENQLNKLKENNTESSLFMDLEVMSTESERWNLFQSIKDKENKDNLFDKIQDFMFSFQIKDKDDIEKFLTEELTYGDKVKDLDIMIEAFIEEERYEDCAILVKIKKKMKKYYLQKQKTE